MNHAIRDAAGVAREALEAAIVVARRSGRETKHGTTRWWVSYTLQVCTAAGQYQVSMPPE